MQTIAHYEVYEAGSGQWSLTARFSGREQKVAISHARAIEEKYRRAVAVLEEVENLVSSQFQVHLIHRSELGRLTIRPPSAQSDMGSRIFMVIVTGIALGVVAAVMAGTILSNTANGGPSGGLFQMLMLGAFLVGAVLGGALLFRIYVPVGLILWNAKDAEARKRIIATLTQGIVVAPTADADAEHSPAFTDRDSPPAPIESGNAFESTPLPVMAPPDPENPADAAVTASAPAPDAPANPAATSANMPAANAPAALAEAGAAVAATALDSIIARARGQLDAFTDNAMTEIVAAHPLPTPSERQALNLYLSGAAQAASDRNALDEIATVALVRHVLERSGISIAEIEIFLAELQAEAERPKFRRMIEGGAAAFAVRIDTPNIPPSPSLTEMIAIWNDPSGQTAAPQLITFLLTDIVGSTALTSQIGNAGAQRVVRAHNAIARAATKAFRGREVKHTGDGMLLTFPDPASGARAAMDIQQEATNYALDNPAAPLVLRVGLHLGEAVLEDGEYYGSAISIVNGLCSLVESSEIGCTEAVRNKIAGPGFRFEEIGPRTLKGSANVIQALKLLWEPKRPAVKGVVEYRQIGTAPSPGS